MKKDKWIELGILIVIPGTIALGVAYMQSYLSFGWIVAFALGVAIVFYICAKYASEPEKGRPLETLRSFINPLVSVSDRQVVNLSYSLSHEHFERKGSLNPHYDFVHLDIIGKRNLKWIKETVIEYNELIKQMNKNISDYENEKTQDLKAVIIGQLEEAKRLAIGLTDRLKEMQKSIIKKSELGKKALEIENKKRGGGKW